MFSVIFRFCVLQRYTFSTIRFWALQCFRQLQPSDFEHFNVLGTSTVRFCVVLGFRRLQQFCVLGNFNHQILRSSSSISFSTSMFYATSTIRFSVLQGFRRLQPSGFASFNFLGILQPTDFAYFKVLCDPSTVRFCILQGFSDLQPSDFEHFKILAYFNHQSFHPLTFWRSSTIRFCVVVCFL